MTRIWPITKRDLVDIFVALFLAAILIAGLVVAAHATYTGADLGMTGAQKEWITSLDSDHGWCCIPADAHPDVPWMASGPFAYGYNPKTTSGYAVNIDGAWYDVDKGSAHVTEPTPNSAINQDGEPGWMKLDRRDVTDNKANLTLLWVQVYSDPQSKPVIRCFVPGASY